MLYHHMIFEMQTVFIYQSLPQILVEVESGIEDRWPKVSY